MNSRIKKISIVVYCNGNFEDTKKTLYSIIDQNVSHLFYDVLIVDDNAKRNFTEKLNNFISENNLVNYHIFSLENYSGLALSLNFLLKNRITKNAYTTIIKSGDIIYDGWISDFLDKLYQLNMDLYMFSIKDELIIPRDKIGISGKNYVLSKSKIAMPFKPGLLGPNEALNTFPIFLGKIWKTKVIERIYIQEDKIMFQDVFVYFQMILWSKKIWYEKKFVGTVRRKSWLPKVMDKRRVELLSLTLDKMISPNPYLNGQILQLLALALDKTPKSDWKEYVLTNHKHLQDNYVFVKTYDMSKRKVLKLTRPLIEFGEIKEKESEENLIMSKN